MDTQQQKVRYLHDFDGSLAKEGGWVGQRCFAEPIPKAVRRIRKWIKKGIEVVIFTDRVAHDPNHIASMEIARWTELYIGIPLVAIHFKDSSYHRIYDNIARQLITDTGKVVNNKKEIKMANKKRKDGTPSEPK